MTDFNPQQARKIVTDLGRTQLLIDGALKKFSMVTTDLIDAFSDAKLNDAAGQPALEELAEGFKTFVEGRRNFVNAHKMLIDMKQDSNLRTVEIGCDPGPLCPWIAPESKLELVA